MAESDRDVLRFARELADLKREVRSWRSPQLDYSSVEDSGNVTFKDGDGNVKAIVGGQDDGTTVINHVDGPTPPAPTAPLVAVDGPIITTNWTGDYEDGATAPLDLSHIEVVAVGPGNERITSTLTIGNKRAGVMAATAEGQWDVWLEAVSLAKKRSAPSESVTIDVTMAELEGPIRDAQQSANGKNQVHYDDRPPTPSDPGIAGDVWWVGTMGRPTDVVEATNLNPNPSFEASSPLTGYLPDPYVTLATFSTAGYYKYGTRGARATVAAGADAFTYVGTPLVSVTGGQWVATGLDVYSRQGSKFSDFRIFFYDASNAYISGPYVGGKTDVSGGFTRIFGGVQAPSNAVSARAYFYIYNDAAGAAPAADTQVSFDGWRIAQSPTQAGAIANVQTYFDGDTPSGLTDSESHYRWTGDPHASTSEKYLPALPNSDADVWNILAQYMHDGTGWQEVQLQHHVFASVDLGKATVGELDGIRIRSRTIQAESLSADAIDGMVITAPTIQSAREGERWVGDSSGITIYEADGTPGTVLASGRSAFRGEVEANAITVTGPASLRSSDNRLESAAQLTLEAGVTDPSQPPKVQPYWEQVSTSGYVSFDTIVGLTWDGTSFWTAVEGAQSAGASSSINNLTLYRIDGGVATRIRVTLPADTPWRTQVFGITYLSGSLYVLGQSNYEGVVWVSGLDGTYQRSFPYPNAGIDSQGKLGYNPTISARGDNLVIAQCADNGPLIWREFTTTGAIVGSANSTNVDYSSNFAGFYVGSADLGGERYVGAKTTSGGLTVSVRDLDSTYHSEQSWYYPPGNVAVGFCWDGARFHSISAAGTITSYGSDSIGDNAGDWWFAYRWEFEDPNDPDNTLDNHSRMGPAVRATWPLRAYMRLDGAALPDGVGNIGGYTAKGATLPDDSSFNRSYTHYDEGKSVCYWKGFDPGLAPPDSNTFPETTPASLRASNDQFEVQGDGSGHWGPLTFPGDGTVQGLPRIATGTGVNFGDVAGSATEDIVVTFPAGVFTSPPVVLVNTSNYKIIPVIAGSPSVTSFTFRVANTTTSTTGNVVGSWIAMQV